MDREGVHTRNAVGRLGATVRGLRTAAALVAVGAAVLSYVVTPSNAQEGAAPARPAFEPLVSIKALMEKTITPATNTIWNAFEPPASEEEWAALHEAAVTLLAAANVTALGGTGPQDAEWVQAPAWQAFNGVMIEAARDVLDAVEARDHDALLAAGDVLYPPCEGCHLQFNPGVVGAQ